MGRLGEWLWRRHPKHFLEVLGALTSVVMTSLRLPAMRPEAAPGGRR